MLGNKSFEIRKEFDVKLKEIYGNDYMGQNSLLERFESEFKRVKRKFP